MSELVGLFCWSCGKIGNFPKDIAPRRWLCKICGKSYAKQQKLEVK